MISDFLHREAHDFADEIQQLLNRTVCTHAQIRAAVEPPSPAGRTFVVGHQASKTNLVPLRVPLRVSTKVPKLWLGLSFRLQMDPEETYVASRSSFVGVFPSEDGRDALFHYDYERNKADNYPDAHLQVRAHDALWAELCPTKPTVKMHFPLGGKRFRPCLEDVIEFLIREDIITGKDGAEKVLQEGRERFQKKQMRAAMRRNKDIVREYVMEDPEFFGVTAS